MVSKFERQIGISALIISIAAFIVSVWQGYETRLNNRNSVKPIAVFSLDFSHSANNQGILITNKGVGPAIVKKYTISYDGEELSFLSDSEILTSMNVLGFYKNISLSKPIKVSVPDDGVFLPSESRLLLGFSGEDVNKERGNYVRELSKLITIEMEYEDVYGTKFTSSYVYE